jgi:hypothetical protein
MDTSQERFQELKKALKDQYDDEPVEVARDGSVHPVGKAEGQAIVLRDPAGEYAAALRPAQRDG